jgi:hypothetical protein
MPAIDRSLTLQPVMKAWLHSTGDASPLAALFLRQIPPAFSVVAPCQRGASSVSVRRQTFITRCLRGACAWLLVLFSVPAVAQQTSPLAPAEATPGFLTRYDFHLSAAGLSIDDIRFSWDTHWGGDIDLVDYGLGRASVLVDYQVVLGDEFRVFDPNQGNYTLETSASIRLGKTEIAGVFHHVSRHISDRPKRFAIAWNVLEARVLRRVSLDRATIDIVAEGGRLVQHSYVDYTWFGQLDLTVRRQVTPAVGVFVHGTGLVFGVEPVPGRGRQTGAVIEAGVRLSGAAATMELFAGYERRLDADPFDGQTRHWAMAGFRLVRR